MFVLCANKNNLTVRRRERITSGSVNAYTVRFEFSPEWDGMAKQVFFRAGLNGEAAAAQLTADGLCEIPWEVMTTPGVRVYAGVYGTRDDEIVLPTVWADLGAVLQGAVPGSNARPPAPESWQQELERKQDKLTGLPGQVVGFDESGSAVAVDMPSGDGEDGAVYEFGHGLKQSGNCVSVDMSSAENPDKTLPISAAAVDAAVGNIEILLKAIRGG